MEFIRSMEGLEDAHITRPGYAIEHDYFDLRNLKPRSKPNLLIVYTSLDKSMGRLAMKKRVCRVY